MRTFEFSSMSLLYFVFGISTLFYYSHGLYTSTDDVIDLTPSNFDRIVKGDAAISYVEFYAPWCGHCQNLAPEWKKFATTMKGIVPVGAVNADEHQNLASQYGVTGYPTIVVFSGNKHYTYQGGRSSQNFVSDAMRRIRELTDLRSGGGSSRNERSSGSSDVVELTDSNFDEVVMKSDEPWLVEFYAPWCGHCKNLKPEWEKAATRLVGKVKLGALDATTHREMASKYKIQGFPTIIFFSSGSKQNMEPEQYFDGRTADDIVAWAEKKAEKSLPDPEIIEIVSSSNFQSSCLDHSLCVISVLPSLYDCDAACRNKYLEVIKVEAIDMKKHKFGWVWTDSEKHQDMQKRFNIGGAGFPTMVVVHWGKSSYVTLRGPFNKDGLDEFFRPIRFGSALPLYPFDGKPVIETVEAWDGKDAPPIKEEDIDLDDVELKSEL